MYFASVDSSIQETHTFYMTIAETVLSKERKDPGTYHIIFLDSDLKWQQADFSLATEMTNVKMNFSFFDFFCFAVVFEFLLLNERTLNHLLEGRCCYCFFRK